MQLAEKGRAFDGQAGGKSYHLWSRLIGLTPAFYRRGIGEVRLAAGAQAVDLGCGTGGLSFALAANADPAAGITGLDISQDQLDFARAQAAHWAGGCRIQFRNQSMDEIPFADASMDLVISAMALHETPAKVRRAAIAEVARVLKPGGSFLLVDWSKPRLSTPSGWLWYLVMHRFAPDHDNWRNVYPEIARRHGLNRREDRYISSYARRQLFIKTPEAS